MPPGGNSQTSKQKTTSGPWPPSQRYIKQGMQKAANMVQNKRGFNPYPGDTYVPFSAQTEAGLGQMEQLASSPNPFYQGNADFTQGLVAGNYNPNAIAQYGTDIASGARNINTEGDLRSLYDQVDPLFEGVVNRQASQIGDDVSRQFGGASFGSAASTGALVDQIGDFRDQMQSGRFMDLQNLKRGLLGDITGVQGQNISNTLNAAGMLSGEQQLGTQNRMAGVGLSDNVYQSQFLPAERLAQVGAAREGKAGEALQSNIDKFNIQQQAGWNRLGAAYPYFTGTGGSTQTQTLSQPSDPFGKILGGGLLASQILPPWLKRGQQ